MNKKSALGKGLGALISDAGQVGKPIVQRSPQSGVNEIEISLIETNPFQPRTKFDEESLEELSASIKALGLIQPITLREIEAGKYQIISGERRYRASKMAGLTKVPAYVRTANDEEMLSMALVENIQRDDLDAIEVAVSYQRLIDECNLTQEKLSERVGKKRTTVTNYLRLLKLPPEIQLGIINKDISMGHARALISLEDHDQKVKIYTDIIEQDLSVRKTEEIVHALKNGSSDEKKIQKPKSILAEEYLSLQNKIADKLKSSIKLKRSEDGKGEIIIPFSSDDDLERIIGFFDTLS